jgi:hypothetical protein
MMYRKTGKSQRLFFPESQGKKCHARAMIHSEAGEAFKMNAHHVPLRQRVM